MITYETDIAVERPAADVIPYLADVARHGSWMGASESVGLSDGPMRPGYRLRYVTGEGDWEVEVTEFTPGIGFSAKTISGPMQWSGTFEVHPHGEGSSRVVSRGTISLPGIKRLVEPLLGGEVRKREHDELVRLKALVEGAATEAATAD
jgi:uncharacterized membrane protein